MFPISEALVSQEYILCTLIVIKWLQFNLINLYEVSRKWFALFNEKSRIKGEQQEIYVWLRRR